LLLVDFYHLAFHSAVMAERAEGSGWEDSPNSEERTPDYHKLLEYGLNEKVSLKLDQIYQQGKLRHEVRDLIEGIICY
jgi:hypothetical protein